MGSADGAAIMIWSLPAIHNGEELTQGGRHPTRPDGSAAWTRGLRVRCSANLTAPDSAAKCYDVPGCTANWETGCRVVSPAAGPYRDIRANMEQTWGAADLGPVRESCVSGALAGGAESADTADTVRNCCCVDAR